MLSELPPISTWDQNSYLIYDRNLASELVHNSGPWPTPFFALGGPCGTECGSKDVKRCPKGPPKWHQILLQFAPKCLFFSWGARPVFGFGRAGKRDHRYRVLLIVIILFSLVATGASTRAQNPLPHLSAVQTLLPHTLLPREHARAPKCSIMGGCEVDLILYVEFQMKRGILINYYNYNYN